MSLVAVSFLILVAAFLVGAVTSINAGLIAIVATFGVGLLLTDLDTDTIMGFFPADLFFILVGATLLFSIVRVTGTIDMLAAWAERLTAGRRSLVPVIMFALTALLATAGAFTPAAVAIVAPVALALGRRFGISTLAMGLVIVQGANAGAFSPVNPFGVVANEMLDAAGAADGSLRLYLYCFVFNAFLAVGGYAAVQAWTVRRRAKHGGPDADADPVDDPELAGGGGTAVATRADPVTAAEVTPMRLTVLGGVAALLLLTLVFNLDVGVSALVISLALIALRPSIQKPAIEGLPWSAVLLVTGIVMYVGLLKEIGAIDALGNAIEGAGASSTATLATSYVVGVLSAFASTTGTLGAISPVVAPLAADPVLGPISVITTIAIASSVVDVSPMSTSGALLLASAEPKNEKPFFRMLLIWAIAMIAIVPGLAWLVFVQLGIG